MPDVLKPVDGVSPECQLEARLREVLRALPGPVLAFSGGVDSSYLLAVLAEARPRSEFRAVLGVSPSLAASQLAQARHVASVLGVIIDEVATNEVEREEYLRNQGDRCFYCKDTLFAALRKLFPSSTLLDGTQLDDATGHRPGKEAAHLHDVRSPLLELGFSKATIRTLSKERGLPTADLPASPCLSSRFPAGERVTEIGLRMIEAAEEHLRAAGFPTCRVRHHGALARIEVPATELPRLAGTALGAKLQDELKALGYTYVALDLAGFRSGSSSYLPNPLDV